MSESGAVPPPSPAPPGSFAAPGAGAARPASRSEAPPGDTRFAAPWSAQPSFGYTAPVEPQTRGLGVVALVIALIAAVIMPILGAVAAGFVGAGVGRQIGENLGAADTLENLALFTPVRDVVLYGEIAFWAGTVLGLWAIVQGIVAIAKDRGRGHAIAAVIVAPVGAGIFAVGVLLAFTLGIGIGGASTVDPGTTVGAVGNVTSAA